MNSMELLQLRCIPIPQFTTTKPPKWKPICCSGFENRSNNQLQSMDNESETTHNHIWKLFTEVQRNIIYLNRQRIRAIQELNEMKAQQKALLQKVQHLEEEAQTHASAQQPDPFLIRTELLLRIDSMVLTEMIDPNEAYEFRSLLTDSKLCLADYFSDIMSKSDAEIFLQLRHFSGKNKINGFHIIHICTEMEPLASVGSLASYVMSLSHVLQRRGNLVEVILPKYASLNLDEIKSLREIEADFFSYFDGQLRKNRIWTGVVNGIGVILIQPVCYSSFFDKEKIYGYPNDFERFSYFSRASLDYILKSGKQPDVLHIHNWETSIVGPLFWEVFANQGLASTRIVLTCQNLNSQCLEKPDKLALCGLDPARLHRRDRLQDNNKPDFVNVLKAGIVYSNKVIVMSSIHSKDEIIRSINHGLEFALDTHKDKLVISPFGYDDSTWDPSKDKFLPQRYSADDTRGKSVSKAALQQQLGLPRDISSILVGCIFLEDSHDVDLESLRTLVLDSSRSGVQFIFAGISDTYETDSKLESFQESLKDGNVRFLDKYDEYLVHLIFAGSDIILCSFTNSMLQVLVKAMKYGALPVPLPVNFADSSSRNLADPNSTKTRLSEYIIITFANISLSQAVDEIKNKTSLWNRKIMEAVSKDVSWEAECYDVHVSAYTTVKS